jgi:hypothetical protein
MGSDYAIEVLIVYGLIKNESELRNSICDAGIKMSIRLTGDAPSTNNFKWKLNHASPQSTLNYRR